MAKDFQWTFLISMNRMLSLFQVLNSISPNFTPESYVELVVGTNLVMSKVKQ